MKNLRNLKSGGINRHVYYGCSRSKDRNCKREYINEKDLIKQFEKLIDRIDIDETGIREKIKEEVSRFKKFQQSILGIKEEITVADVDMRNYAKYVLREGKNIEKRELLVNLKSTLILEDKEITIA